VIGRSHVCALSLSRPSCVSGFRLRCKRREISTCRCCCMGLNRVVVMIVVVAPTSQWHTCWAVSNLARCACASSTSLPYAFTTTNGVTLNDSFFSMPFTLPAHLFRWQCTSSPARSSDLPPIPPPLSTYSISFPRLPRILPTCILSQNIGGDDTASCPPYHTLPASYHGNTGLGGRREGRREGGRGVDFPAAVQQTLRGDYNS
jgi:hypothetical protein